MFFKLHDSAKIGCKLLSNADLGIGDSSHQTHIGLFENTLDFIEDYYQQSFAQFIYKDGVKELVTFLDGITNPDGTSRSPKIRTGNRTELIGVDVNSVVKEIRDIVNNDVSKRWYLMWFGLDTNDIVFFLFDNKGDDYDILKSCIGDFPRRLSLGREHPCFSNVIEYLNTKINDVNIEYLEELESNVQLGEGNTKLVNRVRIRKYDVEKAKIRFQEVGKKGEELINIYLQGLKDVGEITDFIWENNNKESYLPYDFKIIHNNGDIVYSDVKTTGYKFEQDMFFSGNELKFIGDYKNYIIYRVYNVDDNPLLKVCNNINNVSERFSPNYNLFSSEILNEGLKIKNINIGVSPNIKLISFTDEIELLENTTI